MTSTSSSPRADYALIQVDQQSVSPITLTWQNLSMSEPSTHTTKHPDVALTRPLLRGVSGAAQPGELLAIMGPSNAAARDLIECLAHRRLPTIGELSFQPPRSDVTRVGFVSKENLVFGALTVVEHLTFQAELRLRPLATREDRTSRVLEVATQLGLSNNLDTHIGVAGEAKTLAADKRKLLAIAAELLVLPSVLLLEEPTAEMDAFQAETVVQALKHLARTGHTVVTTLALDVPSSIFSLIDRLVLLADGRVVFNGPTLESVTFFEANGLRCPHFTNPFEFFHKQLTANAKSGASSVDQLTAAWNARPPSTVPAMDSVQRAIPSLPSPSLVFGGAFVTRKTTPVYFLWLQQLSPIKYCYHGLMRAFWKPVHAIACPPGTACRAISGLAVLVTNVVEPNKFLSDVAILLAINFAFRVLGGVALAWRTRTTRLRN